MTQYNASEQTQFRLRIVTTSIGGAVIANGSGDGSRSGTGVAQPVYRPGLHIYSRLGHCTRYPTRVQRPMEKSMLSLQSGAGSMILRHKLRMQEMVLASLH